MINEIKIDRTKPVWAMVWDSESKEKHKRPYLYTLGDHHYCVHSGYITTFLNGGDYVATRFDNIEFIKEKKRIPLDAKSCPRWPVLTHPAWGEGVEIYPDICEDGLHAGCLVYLWETLFKGGHLINGVPASREVDE